MQQPVIRQFEQADEVRQFPKGRYEVIRVGDSVIGRATYEPGWKWSEHVAPVASTSLCEVAHLGLVISGHAVAAFADGRIVDLRAGEVFYIPPVPHDSWVVGDEPYVSIHLQGAHEYTK